MYKQTYLTLDIKLVPHLIVNDFTNQNFQWM